MQKKQENQFSNDDDDDGAEFDRFFVCSCRQSRLKNTVIRFVITF